MIKPRASYITCKSPRGAENAGEIIKDPMLNLWVLPGEASIKETNCGGTGG